jgi:hypothetical protein
VFDGAGAADAAVADEAGGRVVPRVVEEVDGVLQGAGGGVVVLGGDEDVAVEGGDLLGPGLGVGLGVLAEGGGATSSRWGILKSAMSTSSYSASVRCLAMSWTQRATASPLRPGRVLPRMIAMRVMTGVSLGWYVRVAGS